METDTVCKENRVVKDHGHSTGNFRGLPHNKCNLKTRSKNASFL